MYGCLLVDVGLIRKPQGNVLIDGSRNPRLTDFGLATVEGEAELQLNTTTAERSFNSRWRAPEVIGIERDPERPNFKSDIYSFGGVMFFVRSLFLCSLTLTFLLSDPLGRYAVEREEFSSNLRRTVQKR
jgi:serine/threonine protein kinase